MKVWFHGVTPERKIAGIQALRKVAQILAAAGESAAGNEPPFSTLHGAANVWMQLQLTGEQFLGFSTDNPEVLRDCVAALEAGGILHATTNDAEFPARPGPVPEAGNGTEPEQEEYEQPPTVVATQIALILMASTDGNSGAALMLARTIQRVLPDDSLWEEVSNHLLDTFPPMDAEQLQALLYEGPPA